MTYEIDMISSGIGALNVMTINAFTYIGNNLIPAIVLLVIGHFAATFTAKFISGLLDLLRVEDILQKYKVEDALGGTQISPMLATISRWYVMLVFLTEAVKRLDLISMNVMIGAALDFAPILIGVGLLVIVSAIIGEWIREAILSLHRFYMQKTIAEILKWGIVILSIVVSLETMGFQMGFVREVFNTMIQGMVYGIAIAFGLAFGFGGQKDAQAIIKATRKKLKL